MDERPTLETAKATAGSNRNFDLTAAIVAVCIVSLSTIVHFMWGLTVSQGWGVLGLPLFVLGAVAVPAALVLIAIRLMRIRPRGRKLLIRLAVLAMLASSLISGTWVMIPMRAFDLGLLTRVSRLVDLHTLRASALQLLVSQSDENHPFVDPAQLPEPIRRLDARATWVRKTHGNGYVFIWWGHSPLPRYGLMITPTATQNRYLAVWPDGMSGHFEGE